LPTQDRSGADRRLIDDFSVAYISSTAVLVASHLRREDRNPSLPDHPFMGIASKAKVRSRTQRRNVRMDEELRAIVKHLPAEFEPLLHVGKTSGVDEIAEIFEKMQGAQHIHFSCHGQFDFEVPVRSTLDILPKRKRSLTALEVFCFGHLPLCDSVFLSACETGRMRTSVIDENLGLTTAFLQSGANSVIATLWLSEYDASVQFSESFYRHAFLDENNISGEHTIFDAFTAAQREYREKAGEDLSVWAPFVYYGTI
jgi:CHAT domain-containing protein